MVAAKKMKCASLSPANEWKTQTVGFGEGERMRCISLAFQAPLLGASIREKIGLDFSANKSSDFSGTVLRSVKLVWKICFKDRALELLLIGDVYLPPAVGPKWRSIYKFVLRQMLCGFVKC